MVTLQRDRYKRDCENKDKQILEYHEALAEKETESMYQSSVIKELEKQLAAYAGDGDNNRPSDQGTKVRELEDKVTRLDDHIAKVEDDKRILKKAQETLQNDLRVAEVQLQDKDKTIQNLTADLEYYKALNKESEKLKDLLKHLEEEMINTKKAIDELSGELSNKVVEIEDLNDLLEEKEQEIMRLTEEKTTTAPLAPEEKKQIIRQLKGQVDELVKKTKTQERQMKELVEKIQLKEAELAIYQQDFESERNDRQRIHDQYEELKTKTEEARKLNKEAVANLGEVIKTQDEEIRVLKTQLNTYSRKNDQNQDEEIQVLTAQVNAYSREVDKQKGLLTQSQEKHKTEVSELNERLANEIQSKLELASELARMRQQLDNISKTNDNELAGLRQQLTNISANYEQLLTAYHEERAKITRLEDQNEKLKKANQ
ncbi:PREDICTED: coiled-coil domain-containing protein 18-like, partial [Amphimedon queenslandica]|uniref:Uncharacterized protein n=1 Tax=Amphimedon queenslandica TaxID=400682 RepID=A0A1X7SUJ4_AMPQE